MPKRLYKLSSTSTTSNKNKFHVSIENCTCFNQSQPLDHFAIGSPKIPNTLLQRYCIYDKYTLENTSKSTTPIFFYTGNESPVEVYINNTGLMWELGEKHNALLVFAEHRYEGRSLPSKNYGVKCQSFSSSAQALEDFNSLLQNLNPNFVRPTILFGGSYGGMLAAWYKLKYSSNVAGAIAASAPIWGFPLTYPPLDGASVAISKALLSGSSSSSSDNTTCSNCIDNLLAAWVLMQQYGLTNDGRSILSSSFQLCHPLQTVKDSRILLEWAQDPWFLLSEGNYPFESNYISEGVEKKSFNLPPWPMTKACQLLERDDFGIEIIYTNKSNVEFTISIMGNLEIAVDWDHVQVMHNQDLSSFNIQVKDVIQDLFVTVKDAIGIWYNMSHTETCFNLDLPPDSTTSSSTSSSFLRNLQEESCHETIATCWNSLNCNEHWNLVNMQARGIGHDFFWPPSHDRNITYKQVINSLKPSLTQECLDPLSIKGFPRDDFDTWSTWIDSYYGGTRISQQASNIIFSNGLFDPWTSGGVSPLPYDMDYNSSKTIPLQINLTQHDVIVLTIDQGAHHLDLMFSHDEDFESVKQVRNIQEEYILKWIHDWNNQQIKRGSFGHEL